MRNGQIVDGSMSGKWSEQDLITEDGVNHGKYTPEECIWSMTQLCEDGYRLCVLLWTDSWTCKNCMELLEGGNKCQKESE